MSEPESHHETDQRAIRLNKLNALKARGENPFDIERYDRTHTPEQIVNAGAAHWDLPDNAREMQVVRVAGRITAARSKGKVTFADIRDETGRVQIYVRRDEIGEAQFEAFSDLDLGDMIGVEGYPFRTRAGEPSIHVKFYVLLTKALRPVPFGKQDESGVVHNALTDREERYRHRYLDLLANPDAKEILAKRCRLVSAIRRFLDGRDFIEVETPVLQLLAGGAYARPFTTHHNALDHDFKLRISLELYLKRLIVGGFDRVYEIGRVFRNEGVSTRHSPEFTMLELYQAYADLDDMMGLVEAMYVSVCTAVNGTPSIPYLGDSIDLSAGPWRRLPMLEGIRQYAGIEPDEFATLERAKSGCRRIGVTFDLDRETTLGGLIEKLHEQYTQPNLIQPTFITDFPTETSPLAKKRRDDPSLTRRFEVYVVTQELGNAFSEINDPIDQRERFERQVEQKDAGDEEAHPMDEDFLMALEYGMPPTGGLGIGIDRLAMILTGAESIRDVVLFPLMRPPK